ncbi:hypothetical protein [Winogradskyella ouciana]|uniref:Uncharacterized protein n=1 Tax=Winogradskyella ouciana TaxID=2608631 RepID=A0A7K1G9P0_9FLAO|nr:hypothetical protein [Winogradskyella ouciana]MTE25871.1 hypothetical protein [Winogradskyella ouciana]
MKVIVYIILVILFAVMGFWFHKGFYELSFSLLKNENVTLINRTTAGQFNSDLIFATSIGLIPLFYLVIEKITNIKFIYKGLIAAAIILITGIVFWRLRIYGLNVQFEELALYDLPDGLIPEFDIVHLKFEIYLFMGFIVGTLISILIFRDHNKPLLN